MKKLNILFSILILSFILVACNKDNTETISESTNTTGETTIETKIETGKGETTKESLKETNKESAKESTKENVVNVDENDNGGKNSVELDTSKPKSDVFNNQINDEMHKTLNDYEVSLVESDNLTKSQYPKDSLQAIAKFENDESFGWIVRYGVNKIAYAIHYKESQINVVVMYNAEKLLDTAITNDSPEEFKKAAEKIAEKQLKNTDIVYAY